MARHAAVDVALEKLHQLAATRRPLQGGGDAREGIGERVLRDLGLVVVGLRTEDGGEEEKGQQGADPVLDLDLAHVRDVIQHLNIEAGVKAINSLRRSGIRYLITTSYGVNTNNGGIKSGEFYRNNMEQPPFSLGKPIRCDRVRSLKRLCLFRL